MRQEDFARVNLRKIHCNVLSLNFTYIGGGGLQGE